MSRMTSWSSTPGRAVKVIPLSWMPRYTEFAIRLIYALDKLGLAFTASDSLQTFDALLEDSTKPVSNHTENNDL